MARAYRPAVLIGALIASAGIADCARLPYVGRDGTLGGTLLAPAPRGATLGEVMSGAAGTYIDRVLADRGMVLERWAEENEQPVRVWIDSSALRDAGEPEYPSQVRSAFAEWVSAGIPLQFAYVGSPKDADIRVHWTPHLDHKTGSTTWRTDRDGYLMNGDITLATHISDGRALDARGMRAIALHEVWHALGLSHSLDPHDVMAALVRVEGLSMSDRNTIKLLYSLPAGPVH